MNKYSGYGGVHGKYVPFSDLYLNSFCSVWTIHLWTNWIFPVLVTKHILYTFGIITFIVFVWR